MNFMNKKEIIKEYMSNLAKKSHEVVLKKYGRSFYSKMATKRWAKRLGDLEQGLKQES